MMSSFIPMLARIDTRILAAVGVIAFIFIVWNLMKKSFKFAVIFGAVALFAGIGISTINGIRENYGVSYNKAEETLSFKVAGEVSVISIKEIRNAGDYIITFKQGTSDTDINISYLRKNCTNVSEQVNNAIKIPNFMTDILRDFFDSAGITYETLLNNSIFGSEFER